MHLPTFDAAPVKAKKKRAITKRIDYRSYDTERLSVKATKKNMPTQNQQQEEAVCVMPVRSGEDPVKEALNLRSESWEEFWLSWMKSDILRQIRLKVALYGGVWPDLYKN